MDKNYLSFLEGYKAMNAFLDELYNITKSDDLGSFLGGMAFNLADGKTMDPAAWIDWLRAVEQVRGQQQNPVKNKEILTIREAYISMLEYLTALQERTNSEDLIVFLGRLSFNKTDGKTMDPSAWEDWLEAVEKVRSEGTEKQ